MDGQTADAGGLHGNVGTWLTGWWCWAPHANEKRKHQGHPGGEGIPGRGAEKGLQGDAQDTQGGAGVSALQTRSKKTAPAGAWGGRVDAEGVEYEYRASAQSARVCRCLHSLILKCWGIC